MSSVHRPNHLSQVIHHALYAGIVVSAGLAITNPAFAQSKTAADADQQKTAVTQGAAPQTSSDLERIEVLGSRIKGVDIETSQPVLVMTREEILAQGVTSVGEVLQRISIAGPAQNTTGNTNGTVNISLRNLGAPRTLTLVNGKRWVGGGFGLQSPVDLSSIPAAAVERIEVLRDGGSVLYGTDALGGVVNVILRESIKGTEISSYYGAYEQGDGVRQSHSIATGTTGEKFSGMFGLGYVQEDRVYAGDREISKSPIYGTGNAFGSLATPGGRFQVCRAVNAAGTCTAVGAPTGIGSAVGTPGATAEFFTYDGKNSGTNARLFNDPADRANYQDETFLVSPVRKLSVFGGVTYNFSPRFYFKSHIQANHRKSEQEMGDPALTLGPSGGINPLARSITISSRSMYNPFGVAGGSEMLGEVRNIQRAISEGANRRNKTKVDSLVFDASLGGYFDIGSRYFDWEVGYVRGESRSKSMQLGLYNLNALKNALGPSFVDANGTPVCGRPDNPATPAVNERNVIEGCMPLNLLGGGVVSPEALGRVQVTTVDSFLYRQSSAFANISGLLFNLPAGEMKFAAGLEHRNEFGRDNPDAAIQAGNVNVAVRPMTQGGFRANEAYVELNIPTLGNLPLVKLLTFNVASRYSNYSSFGNTVNSKVGFSWKVYDDLLFRGTWSQGFRVPQIATLYNAITTSFQNPVDPCSRSGVVGTPGFQDRYSQLTPEEQAVCHRQGVPVGGYLMPTTPNAKVVSGSDVGLGPETNVTKTFGLAFSPSFLPGFDMAVDWWQIRQKNGIINATPAIILQTCIQPRLGQTGGTYAPGAAPTCPLMTRNPDGSLASFDSRDFNFDTDYKEGIDATMRYHFATKNYGKFRFVLDSSYFIRNAFTKTSDSRVGEYAGQDRWRVRSNFATSWNIGRYTVNWLARYYSGQDEICPTLGTEFVTICNKLGNVIADTDPTRLSDNRYLIGENHSGGAVYHDINLTVRFNWDGNLTVGANNVFAKTPPLMLSALGTSFSRSHPLPGRFLFMRYTQKF